MSDFGSIKKLNWKDPKFDEKVTKSTSHDERLKAFSRRGTPITRQGGALKPMLTPAYPDELNPILVVNKAVLQPVKYGPGGPQFQRKRDPSGKFAPSQQVGEQSTAKDDKGKADREAKLRSAKQKDSLLKLKEAKKAMGASMNVPGSNASDASMMGQENDTNAQMLGSTNSGQPIYDDPANSAHANYSPADHQEAAAINEAMAQQAQMQGDQAGAMKYGNNAQTHRDMVQDSQNPSDRFMDNLMGPSETPQMPPEGVPGVPGQPPGMGAQAPGMPGQAPGMDSFMDLMGQEPPPPMPPATPMTDPMMGQDPMAQGAGMGQDPMMQQNAMGQDPMMQEPGMGGDSLSMFTGADQNKPQAPDSMAGPAPGMTHTATGTGMGPQTDVQSADPMANQMSGQMGMGEDNTLDLDQIFGGGDQEYGMDEMQDTNSNQDAAAIEQGNDMDAQDNTPDMPDRNNLEVPDSNAGAPGPSAEPEPKKDDEEKASEDKKKETAFKALEALRRYI